MNNQGNPFYQGSQYPPQQPPVQQGFMPPAQNMRYPVNKPSRAPGGLGKGYHIAMIALGGAVALLALFRFFNSIYLCFRNSSYQVSNVAGSLIYITLGAALIFIAVEKMIDPQRRGEKPGVRMALYISALSASGLTALLGLIHLFDGVVGIVNRLQYSGSFRIEYLLGGFADALFILIGCAVVILYFVFKLIDVVRLRKSTQVPRSFNAAPYGAPMQQPQQYSHYVPQQPPFVQPQQNNNKNPQA